MQKACVEAETQWLKPNVRHPHWHQTLPNIQSGHWSFYRMASWSLGRFYFSLFGSRMSIAEAFWPLRDYSLVIKTFSCCSAQLESRVFLSPPESPCLGTPLTFWISQLNSPQSSRFPPSDSLRCQTCDKDKKDADMRRRCHGCRNSKSNKIAETVPNITDGIQS